MTSQISWTNTNTQRFFYALIAAVVTLLMAACGSTVATPEPTETPPDVSISDVSISVEDQTPVNEITIAKASIDKPGWIEIHAATEEGGFDAATDLGHLFIEPGTYEDLAVELAEPLTESQTLYAMLHYDEPNDEQFTFVPGSSDDPPVVFNGEVVVVPFEVTVAQEIGAAIEVFDQEVADQVIIAEVSIDKPGWIELHSENPEGGFDAATDLGHLFIEPGTYEDLAVELAEPLTESQTLYAMLHYDEPADGQYTFTPGLADDPPVVAEGEVVVKPFQAIVPLGNDVRIRLTSFNFDPQVIHAQPGETLRLLIQNQDRHVFHTFTVEGLEDMIDIPVGGGKTVQREITVPQSASGTFLLYCRPHRGLGMIGDFVAEGS